MIVRTFVFGLLSLLALSPDVWARCELDQATYPARLDTFVADSCYDERPDSAVVRNTVRGTLDPATNDAAERYAHALQAMRQIVAMLEADIDDADDSEDPAVMHAKGLLARLKLASSELSQLQKGELDLGGVQGWSANRWEPGASESETEWFTLKKSLFEADCFREVTDPCDPVFAGHLANVRYVVATDLVSDYVLEIAALAEIERQESLKKQWTSYFNDQQFQYWWELNANYCLFNPRIPKDVGTLRRSVCFIPLVGAGIARRWAQEEADVGWVAPPNRRFIYLHPGVGLMYADGQSSGDSASPALVMQWLGYVGWKGYDENTQKMNNAYGLSLVSTYADLAESDDVGFGVMAHFNSFGFSATRHGDDWAFYLNLNLFQKLQDVDKQVATVGERLKGLP